jgi:photosystem II stability/assembly factor-like uncharacterized protein
MKKNVFLLFAVFIHLFGFSQWNCQNPSPQGNTLNSIFFTVHDGGFAAGDYGMIIKTVNGGSVWNALVSGTTENLYSLQFTDVNTGYAAGAGGTILKTSNGGITWTPLSTGSTDQLRSVFFRAQTQGMPWEQI